MHTRAIVTCFHNGIKMLSSDNYCRLKISDITQCDVFISEATVFFSTIPAYFGSWEKLVCQEYFFSISLPTNLIIKVAAKLHISVLMLNVHTSCRSISYKYHIIVGPLVTRCGVINRLHICCHRFSDFNSPAAPATELRITKPLIKFFGPWWYFSETKHTYFTHIWHGFS